MTRNILASKPRVTRFKINWDNTLANGAEPSNGMEEEGADIENGDTNDGQIVAPDETSMALPREFNENSNSLAMECWRRNIAASIRTLGLFMYVF